VILKERRPTGYITFVTVLVIIRIIKTLIMKWETHIYTSLLHILLWIKDH